MSQRTALLTLAAAIAAALILFLLRDDDRGDRTEGGAALESTGGPGGPASADAETALEGATEAQAVDRTEAPSAASESIAEAAEGTVAAIAEHDRGAPRRILVVRVVRPEGSDEGEPVVVHALARELSHGRLSSTLELDRREDALEPLGLLPELADMAPFDELPTQLAAAILASVEVDPESDVARFEVAADRELWLHGRSATWATRKALRVPPGAAGEELEVTLEPERCAALEVRLGASFEDTRVLLSRQERGGSNPGDPFTNAGGEGEGFAGRRRRTDALGRTALEALPPGRALTLHVRPESAAPLEVDVLPLGPGERRVLDLELPQGGAARGVVLDPEGQPVANAEVIALRRGQSFGFDDALLREGSTDSVGRFLLVGLPDGEILLRANHDDWLESKGVELTSVEGETHEGLELELRVGREIVGSVRFLDGAPAAGIDVRAKFDVGHMAGMGAMSLLKGARTRTSTESDGSFVLRGLGSGPFAVIADGLRPGDSSDRPWRARRDGVHSHEAAADAPPLELVLRAPFTVGGRVVDDLGEAVARTRVSAVRVTAGGASEFEQQRHDRWTREPDGAFTFDDLDEGTWRLSVGTDEHVTLEPLELVLPSEGTVDVELVAHRAAAVTGVVRSPIGGGAGGASVHRVADGPSWADAFRKVPRKLETKADGDGRFELRGLAPGEMTLAADADAFGPATPLTLTLTPGEERPDVVLELTQGGVITGEVYGPDGDPAPGRIVTAQAANFDAASPTTTDTSGLFRIEGLAPGRYQVVAMDLANMGRSSEGDGESFDVGGIMEALEMASVEVVDGEESHVVLGAPPADPVQITGHVTRAGAPLGGALVSFFPAGEGLYEKLATAQSKADGRYALTVDAPGDYVVAVQRVGSGPGQQSTVEYHADVPDAEDFEFNIVVPGGRITGRVRDAEGRAVSGARVSLMREGGARTDELMGGNQAEMQTDARGEYELDGLRPGTYRVSAGGAALLGLGGGGQHGRVTRAGLRVGVDEHVEGIDFELPEPGAIAVTVTGADGSPRGGVTVFAHDSDGRPVEAVSLLQTDASGRARVEGLAPGSYTLSARGTTEASLGGAPVRVRAGETSPAELRLEEGVIVRVRLALKGDGEVPPATVRVLDPNGRDVTAALGMADLQALYLDDAFSRTEHRVGPLAPGRYRIEAEAGELSGKRNVTLRGGGEQAVTVRLR